MDNNENLSERTIDVTNGHDAADDNMENGFYDAYHDSSSPVVMEHGLMPEIQGLELLKKAGSTLKVGRTIKDMFSVVQNMETQLKKVLSINVSLDRDLKDSKDVITDLKEEKIRLEAVIARQEEDLPSKRELQSRIDHLVEERNGVQPQIREMRLKVEDMQGEVSSYRERLDELEEEKKDLLLEIDFLEVKLKAADSNIKSHDREIHTLKGERLIITRKIKALENEQKRALFDKERLVAEIHNLRSGSPVHAGISEVENQNEDVI